MNDNADLKVEEWDSVEKQQRIYDWTDGKSSGLHDQHSLVCAGGYYHDTEEIIYFKHS